MLIPIVLGGAALLGLILLARGRRQPVPPEVERAVADYGNGMATPEQLEGAATTAEQTGFPTTAVELRKIARGTGATGGTGGTATKRMPEDAVRNAPTPEEATAQQARKEAAWTAFQAATATAPTPTRGDVPVPTGTPIELGRITTLAQARTYAQAGYHAALTSAERAAGEQRDKFFAAARLYADAYRLTNRTPAPTVPDARYALQAADQYNDEARGGTATRSSEGLLAPSRASVPRLSTRFTMRLRDVTTMDEARKYAQQGFHASLDRVGSTTGAARDRWINAANLYQAAYALTQDASTPLAGAIYALQSADDVAAQASSLG